MSREVQKKKREPIFCFCGLIKVFAAWVWCSLFVWVSWVSLETRLPFLTWILNWLINLRKYTLFFFLHFEHICLLSDENPQQEMRQLDLQQVTHSNGLHHPQRVTVHSCKPASNTYTSSGCNLVNLKRARILYGWKIHQVKLSLLKCSPSSKLCGVSWGLSHKPHINLSS